MWQKLGFARFHLSGQEYISMIYPKDIFSSVLHLVSKLMIMLSSLTMTKSTPYFYTLLQDFFLSWTYSVKAFSALSFWQPIPPNRPESSGSLFNFFYSRKLQIFLNYSAPNRHKTIFCKVSNLCRSLQRKI